MSMYNQTNAAVENDMTKCKASHTRSRHMHSTGRQSLPGSPSDADLNLLLTTVKHPLDLC